MKKINSKLAVFYETAHGELASALEMLVACKMSASSKRALGYSMHVKDEYYNVRYFFQKAPTIVKRASINKARDFRLKAPSLNLYFF